MERSSPSSPDARTVLEGQLRECFGRIAYSHKTHEKCADILLGRLARIKFWQIVLAAITAGGGVTATFDIKSLGSVGAAVAALLGAVLLVLNAYTKDNDMGQVAQKHKQAAVDLWRVREEYQSLLTALRMKSEAVDKITAKRDALLDSTHAIYKAAPPTNSPAYQAAQVALKINEDMTFSNHEIDAFLPEELKRGAAANAAKTAN